MTPNLEPVIDGGLCIGCGACVAADRTLTLVFDQERQSFRPSGPGGVDAASVCPAIGVDFDWLQRQRFPGAAIGLHGVVESVLLAQSTNDSRNLRASSGGLIKELAIAYLERDDVDGIISIVHNDRLDFRPALITDPAEIDALPGSIYHALPFDGALKLIERRPGRYVLIAIPCQLEGIFTYIFRYAPHLAERIHATIGLLCGWQYTHHALRAICDYKHVDFDKLTDVAYRGGGPVGKLRLTTPDGAKSISRRVDFSYQVAFDRSFNIPRCHLCVNHSNFLADIVVGDAWLPATVYTRTGISLLICRTSASTALVRELQETGKVVAAEVSVDEITESQTHRVVFGDFAYAYHDYLAKRGLPHPIMTGPNRPGAVLADEESVDRFHRELMQKLRLQAERRYRWLWWRKLIIESPQLLRRYLGWFLVRILRIKSLMGKRVEIGRARMRVFR